MNFRRFFLLKVKCRVIADDVGVNENDIILKGPSIITEKEKLIQEISELEERLTSLKGNIPAHSMSVYLMAEIEDNEEEIMQKREMLKKMLK